ncbi:MAG: tRNA (adenosine(37)-N6)-dimethylallyltransferase MiaA [Pseudomonadota bacterium]
MSAEAARRAFALLGPTASGKSGLAMKLAAQLAGRIEIVSVDSAQVYRGMDIGTAKPSAAERRAVPHHLIDIADPTERYSAGRFRADALRAVEGIFERNRTPLLVGGTMLYYRALVSGLDALPAADEAIRKSLNEKAKTLGWPALHAELARVDPKAAARLQPNDAQRIQRALEVFRITGKPMSAFLGRQKKPLEFGLETFAILPRDRAELHRRIEARFDRMLRDGLVEEVRALRRDFDLHADLPSMRCVGYRDVWGFLEGQLTEKEMRERAISATRQLAKRQLSWLRGLRFEPAEGLAAALAR